MANGDAWTRNEDDKVIFNAMNNQGFHMRVVRTSSAIRGRFRRLVDKIMPIKIVKRKKKRRGLKYLKGKISLRLWDTDRHNASRLFLAINDRNRKRRNTPSLYSSSVAYPKG
jgi:hypothetical protein